MAKDSGDGIFAFLTGFLLGTLGGAVVGLLWAPKSGAELRDDVWDLASTATDKMREDIHNPYGKTRGFIDKTRYRIEDGLDRVSQSRNAQRLAEAKRREAEASGDESPLNL